MVRPEPELAEIRRQLDLEYRFLGGLNAEATRTGPAWLAKLTDELKKSLYAFWKQIESENNVRTEEIKG